MEIVRTAHPSYSFRLSSSFLEPYYVQRDPFKTLLARSTYLNKYSRNGETWSDTIKRVVEGNMVLAPGATEREAQLLYHLFWTGQALPPGRGLWVGGVDGIPADARFNCFSKETRFWANGRLVTLGETAGQTVEVRCADGKWRPAEVKSFGKQVLRTVRMAAPGRSNFAFEFSVTPNHRWITNRGVVDDLRVGDLVTVTPEKPDTQGQSYRDGFAHGFVSGDGAHRTLVDDYYNLRLCGEKDWQHEAFLKTASTFTTSSKPPSFNGDPVLHFKSSLDLKAVPSDRTGLEYQAGFLAGLMAADGSLRSNGVGNNRLSSQKYEVLQWVADRAPLLGFCVTGWCIASNMETNLGPRSAPLGQLTLSPDPVEYTVRSITDEGRVEEVFCVVEPETHTFTLEGGVPTGNCWYTTLYSPEDWCWVMNMLMLGGGVGVGLNEIQQLPHVSSTPCRFAVWCKSEHPDLDEVNPNNKHFLNGQTPVYVAEDSREGWVEALRRVMRAAFEGRDLIVDVSPIRRRGLPIKTFGGIACGPGPLTHLLRSAWGIIRGASGRKLTSVEGLDITNMIGFCVKSGNVRRSALIALGDADDQPFRDAKKDWEAVKSHRHTSNNSIVFRSWDQIEKFDWHGLIDDNLQFGEPGVFNLPLVWRTDPGAKGVNPCGEQALEDHEACNLAENFPGQHDATTDSDMTFQLLVRYCIRQRLTPLSDPVSHEVGLKNMRVGVALGGLCDFDWSNDQLAHWYGVCRNEANDYANELRVNRPITVTTVKPSGTISLLNGSSPGIHAPHAPYYIRRTRIAKNDPIVEAFIEAGVPFEQDQYDNTGRTLVFSFPTKAQNTRSSSQTETIRDQFERQRAVQENWADNAVSATLSFNAETEREELAACLKEHVPHLKSTSLLSKSNSYVQAPYEAIDENTYKALAAPIRHDHPLVRGGNFEVDECASGVCPVR